MLRLLQAVLAWRYTLVRVCHFAPPTGLTGKNRHQHKARVHLRSTSQLLTPRVSDTDQQLARYMTRGRTTPAFHTHHNYASKNKITEEKASGIA